MVEILICLSLVYQLNMFICYKKEIGKMDLDKLKRGLKQQKNFLKKKKQSSGSLLFLGSQNRK